MTRRIRTASAALAFAAVTALTLAGCAGGGGGGTLDKAACDALISKDPAPSAQGAASPAPLAASAATAVQPAVATGPAKTADEKKTITFVGGAYTDTTEDYWKDLATKFEAANPGYTVNVQIIDWNNIDQQVATMIQTKQYPDILNENKYSGWASDDLLQDASKLVASDVESDFIPAFKDAGTFQGTQYGLPFITSTRALFYNKDAFAKAGIDAPPTTWRELVDDAEKLTKAGYIGYGLPLGSEESQAEWSIWMWGNGGDWESAPGKFTVNSSKNQDTLTVLNCLTNVYKVTEPNPG